MPELSLYLLHFERPIGRSQHYLGSCESRRLAARMDEHVRGVGAALTREARKRAIRWQVTYLRVIPDRGLERAYKRLGHYPRLCFICQQQLHFPTLDTVYGSQEPLPAKPPTGALDWTTKLTTGGVTQ